MKPFAQACESNKGPLLEVLRKELAQTSEVLEIGSGTGQHAVHFAAGLPHLVWTTSELPKNHPGIRTWIEEAHLCNLRGPLALDVNDPEWSVAGVDGIFTANTLHVMSWRSVESLFRGSARTLAPGGVLTIYGPFRFGGDYTSDSAVELDSLLRMRDPLSGLRDFEDVEGLAMQVGFRFQRSHPMPASNNLLVWRRA